MNYESTFGAVYEQFKWVVNGEKSIRLRNLVVGTPTQHSHHQVNGITLYYDDDRALWIVEDEDGFSSYESAHSAAMSTPKKYTGRIADWPKGTFRTVGNPTVETIVHAGDGKGVWIYGWGGPDHIDIIYATEAPYTWEKVEG